MKAFARPGVGTDSGATRLQPPLVMLTGVEFAKPATPGQATPAQEDMSKNCLASNKEMYLLDRCDSAKNSFSAA